MTRVNRPPHAGLVSCFAKAQTPFGDLSGRTLLHVEYLAEDLARVEFTVGSTPVAFTMSGGNLHGFTRALIECANRMMAARLLSELEDVERDVS